MIASIMAEVRARYAVRFGEADIAPWPRTPWFGDRNENEVQGSSTPRPRAIRTSPEKVLSTDHL
jgi:hypothetical protein